MSVRLLVATLTIAAAAAVTPAVGEAQGRGRAGAAIPPGHYPPAGLCRVWYDGVPPGRQPAPTSCAQARRDAPRNARVIYGGDRDGRYDGRQDDRNDRDRRDRDDRRGDDRWERERWERERRERERLERSRIERSRVGRNLPRAEPSGVPRNLPRGGARNLPRCDDRASRNGNCDWDDDVRCRETGRDVVCDRATTASRARGPLPLMPSTRDLRRNRIDREAARWLGVREARSTFVDRNRDGTPERVVWTDSRGRRMQTWIDLTGNRRADRVILHR